MENSATPKRPVNMTLSPDLVRRARALTNNLSETVEMLLHTHVAAEEARRAGSAPRAAASPAWVLAETAAQQAAPGFAEKARPIAPPGNAPDAAYDWMRARRDARTRVGLTSVQILDLLHEAE
jgi:post-segregation antitoxin (ccd killing protein)